MENTLKLEDHPLSSEKKSENRATMSLPEWHPFAVWQTQIREERTSQTGTFRVIQSVDTADV